MEKLIQINASLLAIGMNDNDEPLCLIVNPESFVDQVVDVTLITSATLTETTLTLQAGEAVIMLHDITQAQRAVALACKCLVVLDPAKQYESLMEILT